MPKYDDDDEQGRVSAVDQLCAEPGCKRPRTTTWGGRQRRYCRKHWREYANARYLARQGDRLGATCLICGEGPYVKVGSHTWRRHGVSRAEYLRMFPGADMTHPDLKPAFKLDAELNGAGPQNGVGKSRRACRHQRVGANAKIVGGRVFCRKCLREADQARRQRAVDASGTKLCECGCGTEIPRISLVGRPRRFVQGHPYNRKYATATERMVAYQRRRRGAAGTRFCELRLRHRDPRTHGRFAAGPLPAATTSSSPGGHNPGAAESRSESRPAPVQGFVPISPISVRAQASTEMRAPPQAGRALAQRGAPRLTHLGPI